MTDNEVEKKFILGGAVVYQDKLWSVVGVNSINHTYTLERLPDGRRITDIKASEVEDD